MAFNFLPYDQDQLLLMPPSLQEWVSDGSLARFISDLVDEFDERGDLGLFYARYRADGWGRAAYSPLFLSVLELCREAGLVKALDGRRVPGNAALERNRTKAQLQEEVKKILREADEIDAAEDALYGEDKRGDELPAELQTREGRLKAIRRALDVLKKPEDEARAAHEQKLQERRRKELETGRRPKGAEPKLNETKIAERRANLTDPESRTMKSRKGFVQGYNGQIMVDCETQIIVAQDLRQEPIDRQLLGPMLHACERQTGCVPEICIADNGYWSEANFALHSERTDLYIAMGKSAEIHGHPHRRARKKGPDKGPQAIAMRQKLDTEDARSLYRLRSSTVEPVFGQMYERGLNRIGLRGVTKARTEWSMWCTTHNVLKLWRYFRLAWA